MVVYPINFTTVESDVVPFDLILVTDEILSA